MSRVNAKQTVVLVARGELVITDIKCVSDSNPNLWSANPARTVETAKFASRAHYDCVV